MANVFADDTSILIAGNSANNVQSKINETIVGTSHSATGAIESALKYVSPDAIG
jgi:hypothetical protein